MKKVIYVVVDLCILGLYSLVTLFWVRIERVDASSYYPGDITDSGKLDRLLAYPAVLIIVLVLFLASMIRHQPHWIRWVVITVLINLLVYIPLLYHSLYLF